MIHILARWFTTISILTHWPFTFLPNQTAYIRIKQLPIKLEKPIDVTTESELKGTAILPPEIKPYQGDVIRFNLLNGRDTLFSITEIEENTYNIDKVYKSKFLYVRVRLLFRISI